MPDDALPPLREVIATHNLRAERKFGQNFILDLNLTQRIARAGGDLSECSVIEIGPGPGGLTRGLLMSGARKVIVIEADERFLPALEDIKTAYPDRLEIVQGDALQIFPDSLTAEPYRIISNLPYNIATPLFTGWLENSWRDGAWTPSFLSMTCMFQKEVAQRIVAAPETNCTSFHEIPASFIASRAALTPYSTKFLPHLPQGCMPTPKIAMSFDIDQLLLSTVQQRFPFPSKLFGFVSFK